MARSKSRQGEEEVIDLHGANKVNLKKFKFTKKQKEFFKIALDKETKIVFISGPAGSAKTFDAVYAALQLYNADSDRDILYLRTIAESGAKSMGSLPGEVQDKFHPFMGPLEDKLVEILDKTDIKSLKNKGAISAAPVNYLRGASWNNKIVISDESQNYNLKELTTLITRIGNNTTIFICGDPMQSDINGSSGFSKMMETFRSRESEYKGIYCVELDKEDIMRSEILKYIIEKLSYV
jgi:phosphate starvation-inducible protein PhoH and related proteins